MTTSRTASALGAAPVAGAWGASPDNVIEAETAEGLAFRLKALSDPTRVRLLSLIAATEGGEACICDLTAPVALSQPTVSHHMRQLLDAGLVTRQQRGKWAYYRIADGAVESLSLALMSIAGPARDQATCLGPPPVGTGTGDHSDPTSPQRDPQTGRRS